MNTPADPRERRIVTIVFVTVFLDMIGFGIVIPLMPFYVKGMGGGANTVGVLLSSFAFTQLLATPLLGRLSDRFGRRPVMLLSLAGNVAAMVLFAIAAKVGLLWLLFASRILAGGTSGNLAACQAAIADVTTKETRARGMGRLGAGMGLGMVLGPFLGGFASQAGLWVPPLAAAALAGLDLVGALVWMPETRAVGTTSQPAPGVPTSRGGLAALRKTFERPGLAQVVLLGFLTFSYLASMQSSLALVTNLRLGWTANDVGHVFGLFGIAMLIVQGLLIGRLTRHFDPAALAVFGSLASMLGLLGMAASHAAVPMVASLMGLAVGLALVNPCLATLAADFAGHENRGAILGISQSAGGLGRTLGPVAGGALYQYVSPSAPFLEGAAAALASIGIGMAVLATRRRTMMPRAPELSRSGGAP